MPVLAQKDSTSGRYDNQCHGQFRKPLTVRQTYPSIMIQILIHCKALCNNQLLFGPHVFGYRKLPVTSKYNSIQGRRQVGAWGCLVFRCEQCINQLYSQKVRTPKIKNLSTAMLYSNHHDSSFDHTMYVAARSADPLFSERFHPFCSDGLLLSYHHEHLPLFFSLLVVLLLGFSFIFLNPYFFHPSLPA